MNHPVMVILYENNLIFICDNGYEFELTNTQTILHKYKKCDLKDIDSTDPLYMNGYHYSGYKITIVYEYNERLPITPNNFHKYLHKILNLKAFL